MIRIPSFRDNKPSLSALISEKKWDEVVVVLHTGKFSINDSTTDVTEDTILHHACRNRATLHIIELLASHFPSCLTSADSRNRYPIHHASKHLACVDTFRYLIDTNSIAAGIQDSYGKTAMHYLAEHYIKNFKETLQACPLDEYESSMLRVVRMLKIASPKSFNLEDKAGTNCIEYAIENGVCLRVIKAFQCTCRDDWKKRKQDDSNKSHSDLTKELEELSAILKEEIDFSRSLNKSCEEKSTSIKSFFQLSLRKYIEMLKPHTDGARSA